MTVAHAPSSAARVDAAVATCSTSPASWTAATSPDERHRLESLASAAADTLEAAPAHEILRWAFDTIDDLVVTSSFGIDSAVLLHLVAEHAPGTPVVFLDTGLHFPETLAHRDELTDLFDLATVNVTPSLDMPAQERLVGRRLFATDADTCCMLRKGLPLQAALAGADGWATGVRRTQTATRASIPVVGTSRQGDRTLLKVAPLARWSDDDMAAHRRIHDLPAHPLEQRGYRSVGCQPCTRPTREGEDARAGRWSLDPDKTECGIHLESDSERSVRATEADDTGPDDEESAPS